MTVERERRSPTKVGKRLLAVVIGALLAAGGSFYFPALATTPSRPLASIAAQVLQAEVRLVGSLRQAHPGLVEALLHPDADHAGMTLSVASAGPAAYSAAAYSAATSLPGLDVSSFQGNVNWLGVAKSGAKFAYVKATEGTYYSNPYFRQQYTGSASGGLIRGAYHFAIPDNSSGAAQADFFVAHGGGWSADNHTLPGAVDLEGNPYGPACYGLSPAQMVSWVTSFISEYHADTGRWAGIYTTRSWWSACTGSSSLFASRDPLWVARYAPTAGALPAGWTTYTFWQHADRGIFPGDQDVFNGSATRLLALANNNGGTLVATSRAKPAPTTPPPCKGIPIRLLGLSLCL